MGVVSYSLEFKLDGLPKMTNPSGARSTHWRVIKKERDNWKSLVVEAASGKKPPEPLKKARLTLIRHSSVSPDPDGLVSGFKAIIDGLVEAGVLENDRFENIGMPQYLWSKVQPRKGYIEVRVKECL